jgi:hypothetical protein
MPYEYDPYLTGSTARGLRILSIGMITCGIYLVPVSLHAWQSNTMIRIGNTGRMQYWPWEGFVTAFLMIAVGIFAWSLAGKKAKEWKERNKG